MKALAQKTLLACVATAISLLLAEFIVSVMKPQNLSGSWRVQTDDGLMVNKSTGSARHQFGERVVYYNFTEPHLRERAPEARVKVLVLGDSFTFGWLLDRKDTYVNLLQSKIDAEFGSGIFSLLNAAAGGWGTGDFVAFVEDFGEEIAPDIILVFLNIDDIGRALRSPLWSFGASGTSLTRAMVPKDKTKVFLNRLPGYQWSLEHSHFVQLARTVSLSSKDEFRPAQLPMTDGPRSDHSVESAGRIRRLGVELFRRLGTWCKERNVQLLVSTTGWHTPPYAESSEPTKVFMSSAESLFGDLAIPFSDPSDVLWQRRSTSQSSYIIPDDGHPNEAGAALIAEHVFPFIQSQLRGYCRLTNRCWGRGDARP